MHHAMNAYFILNNTTALSVKDCDCDNSLAASYLKDSLFCISLSRKIWLSARKDLGSIIKHWRLESTWRLVEIGSACVCLIFLPFKQKRTYQVFQRFGI